MHLLPSQSSASIRSKIPITVTSFTHTCNGNHSANLKQLKTGCFAEPKIVNVHKFAKLRKNVSRILTSESIRYDLLMDLF